MAELIKEVAELIKEMAELIKEVPHHGYEDSSTNSNKLMGYVKGFPAKKKISKID